MSLSNFLAQSFWRAINPVIVPTTTLLPSIKRLHCWTDPKLDVPIGSRWCRKSLLAYSSRRVLDELLCGQGYGLTRASEFPHL